MPMNTSNEECDSINNPDSSALRKETEFARREDRVRMERHIVLAEEIDCARRRDRLR